MATKFWVGGTGGSETDVNTAGNYSPSGVPTTGDDLYVEAPSGTTYNMAASLSSLSGVTLASLNIAQSYTGNIGTASAYLQVSATVINIGYNYTSTSQSGSSLIKLNVGSVQTTANILNTSRSSSTVGSGPVSILGTHASNVLNILSGTVSVAATTGEVSTFTRIVNDGTLIVGSGITLATLDSTGTTTLRGAATTVNQNGGTINTFGSGAITTVNVNSGTFFSQSTGTITTLNIYSGTADFRSDYQSKTITNVNIYNQGKIYLDNGVKNSITLTNGITLNCNFGQWTVQPWTGSVIKLS